jgi:hypothetical protein
MTMQHDRIHQGSGRSVSFKRLLGATAALPAAIAGLMMAFAADTPASAHDYTISPTVFQFPGSTTETLSGAFSFSTDAFTSQNFGFFASNGSTGSIALTFAAALAGQPDDITGFDVSSGCIHLHGCVADTLATGIPTGASAVPAVPEPSSIALLGAALAFFGFKRRSTQRR